MSLCAPQRLSGWRSGTVVAVLRFFPCGHSTGSRKILLCLRSLSLRMDDDVIRFSMFHRWKRLPVFILDFFPTDAAAHAAAFAGFPMRHLCWALHRRSPAVAATGMASDWVPGRRHAIRCRRSPVGDGNRAWNGYHHPLEEQKGARTHGCRCRARACVRWSMRTQMPVTREEGDGKRSISRS